MENLSFANINFLWVLLLIPIFFAIYILLYIKRKKQLSKLGKPKIVKSLTIEPSTFRPWLKFCLNMFALSLIIIAIARPQFISETKVNASENNEIFIALDISNSMLANSQNSNISRLDLAKNAILKLVDNANGDKVGLVVFAGQAVMMIPITRDYSAFKIILQSLSPEYITAQGTNISDAIKLSLKSFTLDENLQKSIILISDGEDHEGNTENICDEAKKIGIKIYTVGIGSSRGEPIYLNGQVLKDEQGNIVMSKLNENLLLKIAKSTDGEYFNFSTNRNSLDNIYTDINKTDKSGKTKIAKFDDKFHYFLFPALLILFFEFFILNRKNRWLAKIRIFDSKE